MGCRASRFCSARGQWIRDGDWCTAGAHYQSAHRSATPNRSGHTSAPLPPLRLNAYTDRAFLPSLGGEPLAYGLGSHFLVLVSVLEEPEWFLSWPQCPPRSCRFYRLPSALQSKLQYRKRYPNGRDNDFSRAGYNESKEPTCTLAVMDLKYLNHPQCPFQAKGSSPELHQQPSAPLAILDHV